MVARTPDGPPPPPVVQRLRVRYAKRGRLRFTSHRDFARALERALRRAGVPMAFSAGFTPHPKISYVGAAPTGVASEAEYVELALAELRDPGEVRDALDASLPVGLDVVEVVEVPAGATSLAERMQASVWTVRLPGLAAAEVQSAVTAFLAADSVVVERLTTKGVRLLDARAAVLDLTVTDDPAVTESDTPPAARHATPRCAILQMVVRQLTPAVRPDDALTGLRLVGGLVPPVTTLVTRQAQGPLEADGQVSDPLAPDRAAIGAVVGSGASS